MDDQENKHQQKTLEDFLKKAEAGDLGDDFEKEAAEGFALLGHEESLKLKAETDRRVAPLFSSKKKQALPWSIAAGVVLLISITVYFLRQDVTSAEMTVVQTSVSDKREELTAPPAPVVGPQAATASEQKPVLTARSKFSAQQPAPFKSDKPSGDLTAEAPKEEQNADMTQTEKETEVQPIEIAANDKVSQTAPVSGQFNTYAPQSLGSAGEGFTISSSDDAKKSKSKEMKKSARAAAEPQPAAAPETRQDRADTSPELNKILSKKIEASHKKLFSAILVINEGLIKDVVFTSGELSKAEKKEIKKALLELTVEDLRPAGLTNGETRFDYRP